MLRFLPSLATSLVLAAPAEVSFKSEVAPILVRRCLGCHDHAKAKGGLNLDTFALLRKGGKTAGADILVPGDPEGSGLIESIRPDAEPRMPYKQPPLPAEETALLERWVREGAKFDGPSETDSTTASLVDPLANLPTVAMKVAASEPATSAAISPDGGSIAAAVGASVLVFDREGLLRSRFDDHPGPLTFVAFTPDGNRLISAGGRAGMFGSIAAWEVDSGRRVFEVRGHADGILSAALSPDGRLLATASYDRLVKLWEVATGREVRTLKEHTDAVHAVAFSPDGNRLATVSADRTLKLWDVASGEKRASVGDATAELYAVAFSADGGTIYAAGVDRSIRSWNLRDDSLALAQSVFAHDGAVIRLVVTADGKTLATAGEDRAIKLWDLPALRPRVTISDRPDWPMALAISGDGTRLVAGHYDGSIAVLSAADGKELLALRDRDGKGKRPPPQLSRDGTLGPLRPRGGRRGETVKVRLEGLGVGRADLVVIEEPGISATILPRDKPEADALDVALTIAPDARIGVHRLSVRTPLGIPASRPFSVEDAPESAEVEGRDVPEVALPAVLAGTIDRPGDVDSWRFAAEAGEEVAFEAVARALGSKMNPSLAVSGPDGSILAESLPGLLGAEASLAFRPSESGLYTIRIGDMDLGGSGDSAYRVRAGRFPRVEAVFPLATEPGRTLELQVSGANLGGRSFRFEAPSAAWKGGEVAVVSPPAFRDLPSAGSSRVAVAEGPRTVEIGRQDSSNDSPMGAEPIAAPGGVSGTIATPGDADFYRFEAREGRPVVVEVFGRRLGSPIDPAMEVLDVRGEPVPLAVLKPVEETNVAFRDHNATSRTMRLTEWVDFFENDLVLIGRELTRIAEMPRNPDDDAVLWGTGRGRGGSGDRVALLGTSPEHHPQGQAIFKVEVHPPGTSFPPGGPSPVILNYRNDDAGPGVGKDCLLRFDPPADGAYLVRVEDVRGLGGADFGYHLLVREPVPDFRLSLSQDDLNVPRGGTAMIQVNAERRDGYDGAIAIAVKGLPPGVTAVPSRIEPGAFTASIVFSADPSAPAMSPPSWSVTGTATLLGSGETITHRIDPGGPSSGYVTVTAEPNLKVDFSPERVAIRPGERVEITLSVERSPAFSGRVPIELRNLPSGVKVLNIGLNGVLVTEAETSRRVVLYAEPWAPPTERPVFAVGSCEAAGTEHPSRAIELSVLPASGEGRSPGESAPR